MYFQTSYDYPPYLLGLFPHRLVQVESRVFLLIRKSSSFQKMTPDFFLWTFILNTAVYLKISDAETFWPLIVKLDLLMYFPSNHGYL